MWDNSTYMYKKTYKLYMYYVVKVLTSKAKLTMTHQQESNVAPTVCPCHYKRWKCINV